MRGLLHRPAAAGRTRIALAALLSLSLIAAWVTAFRDNRASTGYFTLLGMDYGHYWAQANVWRYRKPVDIYDERVLARARGYLITGHSPHPPRSVRPSHVPYPPVFAAAFSAFTYVTPKVGFALWSALNAVGVLLLARRAVSLLRPGDRTLGWVVALFAYPVVFTVYVGQIQIWLALALGECFLALRAGRDFRAGLWLGAFLFKPQYGALLGLALLAKGHWRMAAGTAVVLALLLVSALAIAGPGTLALYPHAMGEMEKFDLADVRLMANWRSIVALFVPDITQLRDLQCAFVLGALTLVAVVPLWRGRLDPASDRFTLAFALLVLASLLAGYHLFSYGSAILIVPLAAALASARVSGVTRLAAAAALLAPTIPFTLLPGPGLIGMEDSSRMLALLLVVLFVALLADVYRAPGGTATAERGGGVAQGVDAAVERGTETTPRCLA